MTPRRPHTIVVAVLTAVAVLSNAALGVSPARAERPLIDPAQLPPPSAPAPLEPTEQKNACALPSGTTDPQEVPTALKALDFASVWPITRGAGQLVAVIDTGVTAHPRLPGLIPGGDYVSAGDGLFDCDAHGTMVAGLIAAQTAPGSGFAGGAPDARILSIRQSSNVFQIVDNRPDEEKAAEPENAAGYGNVRTMAMAIRTAVDSGASVINISEVACVPTGGGVPDGPLGAAVQYAVRERNVVVVAAAGNLGGSACQAQNPRTDPLRPDADPWNGFATIATPAWFDDVLTVGSVESDGTPSSFSLAGPWVDVAAPGSNMTSLSPSGSGLANGTRGNDGVNPMTGTSFAAPLVAAVAALVRAHRPELTALEVVDRIQRTAHAPAEGWNPLVGHGVVDPLAAVTDLVVPAPRAAPADSVAMRAPLPPPAPDHRPRNAAVTGSVLVAVILALGLALSIPLRRRGRP
ncbi:type VII secretion-associated serine protease mycosin [Rhodococcus yunnanensis]|uniref:Type VII secretion-associated serine protease mycosin n=1 Tax=Rhodococcoides yunnanense TaxID=278209 RepID=A0ABU4BGR3_9NOCA|nr:type VII secretion-associated serine protease mycosin [Rhodococcus yunnanensis]MDV6263401.1 type VII secretion-associated serine protease mycosin [Rhodococcus yunnanensis]